MHVANKDSAWLLVNHTTTKIKEWAIILVD